MKKEVKSQATSMADIEDAAKKKFLFVALLIGYIIWALAIVYLMLSCPDSKLIWLGILGLTAIIAFIFLLLSWLGVFQGVIKVIRDKKWIKYSILLSIVVGLISSFVQIRDTDNKAIFVFLLLLTGLIALKAYLMIRAKIAKNLELKIKLEKEKQLLAKEEALTNAKLAEATKTLQRITLTGSASWNDILSTMCLYSNDHLKVDGFIDAITSAQLVELVTISHIKQHITWDDRLNNALKLLERALLTSFEDSVIERISNSIKSLNEEIIKLEGYSGYAVLKRTMTATCPQTLFLLERMERMTRKK